MTFSATLVRLPLVGLLQLLLMIPPVLAQPTSAKKSEAQLTGGYDKSWAVVIGVDVYQKFPRLGYAVADAKAVAAQITSLGFPTGNIHVLLDGEATKARIESTLYRNLNAMGPNDRLLVYFAGHGETLPIRRGEEGYILPVDADPAALPLTAIAMEDIQRIAQRLPAKHYLFILDACFSGFAATRAGDSKTLTQEYLANALREPVVEVITAGRKGQRSIEEQGHGLFTRYLLEGLRGHADLEGRGSFSARQLAVWLEPRVMQASRGRMTPQYRVDGEGSFMLKMPGAQLRAPAPDLSGTFTGIIQGKVGDRSVIRDATVTFNQKGNNLSGTWMSAGGSSGTLTGIIDGTQVRTFRVIQSVPCARVFHGTGVADDHRNALSGKYSGLECDGSPLTATFRVSRVDREPKLEDTPLDLQDLVNIAMSYSQQERYQEAIDYFHQARRVAEEKKNETARARMLMFIGSMYERMKHDADAIDYFEQGLRASERANDAQGEAFASNMLGLLHLTQDRFGEAERYFKRDLVAAEKLGDEREQARAIYGLGLVAIKQQRSADALRHLDMALAIAERLKMPEGEGIRRDRDAVLKAGQ